MTWINGESTGNALVDGVTTTRDNEQDNNKTIANFDYIV